MRVPVPVNTFSVGFGVVVNFHVPMEAHARLGRFRSGKWNCVFQSKHHMLLTAAFKLYCKYRAYDEPKDPSELLVAFRNSAGSEFFFSFGALHAEAS